MSNFAKFLVLNFSKVDKMAPFLFPIISQWATSLHSAMPQRETLTDARRRLSSEERSYLKLIDLCITQL